MIISLFLGRFTLNEKEAETITSRDVPLGPKFFETMDKTERIREDCMVLMAAEDGPTKAGYVSKKQATLTVIDARAAWT